MENSAIYNLVARALFLEEPIYIFIISMRILLLFKHSVYNRDI